MPAGHGGPGPAHTSTCTPYTSHKPYQKCHSSKNAFLTRAALFWHVRASGAVRPESEAGGQDSVAYPSSPLALLSTKACSKVRTDVHLDDLDYSPDEQASHPSPDQSFVWRINHTYLSMPPKTAPAATAAPVEAARVRLPIRSAACECHPFGLRIPVGS